MQSSSEMDEDQWNGNVYEYSLTGELMHRKSGTGTNQKDWFYAYTADGERIWSYFRDNLGVSSVTTPPLQNYHSRFSIRDLDGKVLRSYFNTTWEQDYIYRGGTLLESRFPASADYDEVHYFSDHLGSPRLLTDENGNRIAYHVYRPFGQELTAVNQDSEVMKFTGHERDLGSNLNSDQDDLDYMHARHYNMQLGRFLQPDPVLGRMGAPQSWNRYSYVMGNPMNLVDPTGERSFAFHWAATNTIAGFWGSPITVSASGGGFSYFQYQVLFGGSSRVVQAAGKIGRVARAGGPFGLAVGAGIGLGWGVNQIPGVSEALTIDPLTEWASDLIVAMGKGPQGSVTDSRLVGKTADYILGELTKEKLKGRLKDKKWVRTLERALKELGQRGNKPRGGRRGSQDSPERLTSWTLSRPYAVSVVLSKENLATDGR